MSEISGKSGPIFIVFELKYKDHRHKWIDLFNAKVANVPI